MTETPREKLIQYLKDAFVKCKNKEYNLVDDIMNIFQKEIDNVEQEYKSKLNNWGKQQPMTDMYPKEMDVLNKIRKRIK